MEWTPVDLAMARQHQQRMATAVQITKALRAGEMERTMTEARYVTLRRAAGWMIAHGLMETHHLRVRLHRRRASTTAIAID